MSDLTEQGWDCYPEVEMPFGGRADIVGVRPFPFLEHRQCVHVVECKTSWTKRDGVEARKEKNATRFYPTDGTP